MDVCALGQCFVIQFVNSGMYSFEHLRGILTAQHLHNTFYAVREITFAIIKAQYTLALQAAIFQLSDIIQIHRYSIIRFDNDTS